QWNVGLSNSNHPPDQSANHRLVQGMIPESEIPHGAALHIDPDRRGKNAGERYTNADYYAPDANTVLDLVTTAPGALVKIAPAADWSLVDPLAMRMWISCDGSVREQGVVYGSIAQRLRRALPSVPPRGACQFGDPAANRLVVQIVGDQIRVFRADPIPDDAVSPMPTAADWIISPDPAIRAAGLTSAFADALNLVPIGHASGYLTNASPVETGGPRPNAESSLHEMADWYRVLWRGPAKKKPVRGALELLGGCIGSVKKRGGALDPLTVHKQWNIPGDRALVLILGQTHPRSAPWAALCLRPVSE
ncbi:MAG: hypothetical protein AAFP90_19475, partial [Planctomycetota bacterium]